MYSPRLMSDPGIRVDRPIVLVGLMGAGKSTVGRRLARRLNLGFVDSDEEIEQSAGFGIAEIFERFDEAFFRDLERRTMARLVAGSPKVIAAGGGAFLDAGVRALVLERCLAIWIEARADILAQRLSGSDRRPLLKQGEPALALARLAEQRNPIYAEAHLAVDGECAAADVVDRILDALERRSER